MWIEDRSAEEARTARGVGVPQRPARVYLGTALVRLGRWIMGPHLSDSGGPIVSGAGR
jgi:hypothetical protein